LFQKFSINIFLFNQQSTIVMVKLFTILLIVGATNLVAAPTHCVQELDCTVVLLAGSVSEQVADNLLGQAADEWSTTKIILWKEYRSGLITIDKIGIINGEETYQVDRLKTGGSLVLILDVEAA
jgi:hypothetical protein